MRSSRTAIQAGCAAGTRVLSCFPRRTESGDTPRNIVCAIDRVLGSRRTPVLPQASASPLATCPPEQKRLRKLTFATELERSEILVPKPLWRFRPGFAPQLQLVQVFGSDFSLHHPVEEMVAERFWQVRPLDLRHYLPKVIRASSRFKLSRSWGSRHSLSWSASVKNRVFSACFDSNPAWIRSTSTRFALVFCVFASPRTRRAIRSGMETLCRTTFSICGIVVIYTILHQPASSFPRGVLSAGGQRRFTCGF